MNQTGRVIAVDEQSVWVDVSRQSACNSCQARNGCGKRLLDNSGLSTAHTLKLSRGENLVAIGDELELVLPDGDISSASLLLYITPLVLMLVCAGIAHALWAQEPLTIAACGLGLALGGIAMRQLDRWQGCRLSSHLLIKQVKA